MQKLIPRCRTWFLSAEAFLGLGAEVDSWVQTLPPQFRNWPLSAEIDSSVQTLSPQCRNVLPECGNWPLSTEINSSVHKLIHQNRNLLLSARKSSLQKWIPQSRQWPPEYRTGFLGAGIIPQCRNYSSEQKSSPQCSQAWPRRLHWEVTSVWIPINTTLLT